MLNKLLRYPIDIWAVLLVVATFVVQLSLYLCSERLWLLLLGLLLLIPLLMSITAYNHNHSHLPAFKNRTLNRVFEVIIFFQTGSTPFSVALNHIFGHHANYFKPELDTLNWKKKNGKKMTRLEFALIHGLNHYPSCFVFGKKAKGLFSKFVVYLLICLVLLLTLVVINPINALFAFLIPMIAMQYILKWGAYPHHTGLGYGDDYTASRSNTARLYNWYTWNSGYHAAHHFKQALHWSKLPEFHETLRGRLPSELEGRGWGKDYISNLS